MNYLEEAQKFFKDDIFATKTVGIEINEVKVDYAKCTLEIEQRHLNANNQVMGGAIFSLADFAFAVASNVEEKSTVSLTSSIQYIGVVKGKKLIAQCKSKKTGRTASFFETTITDDLGNLVAIVTATGMKTHAKK